jgi:DNA-binding transcriptional MerR regulator
MTIGELARRANVNPRTLRYYERIGLLAPATRTAAGYRLYTEQDAARLSFIRHAQALGLSLAEIAAILALRAAGTIPCRHVATLAREKVALIDAHLSALQALRDDLSALADRAEMVEMLTDTDDAGICSAIEGIVPRSS